MLTGGGYLMKMYAGLAYAVLFWLLSISVQHYQAAFLPAEHQLHDEPGVNPQFWDNFGLSCISNVLMGGLYLIGYAGHMAFHKLYGNQRRNQANRSVTEATEQSVFCVEEEAPAQQQHDFGGPIQLPQPEEEESNQRITLQVTPTQLWYYMYTTGWGVFCMAYTLHGAHWISSLCLCAGTLICSVWGVLTEKQLNSNCKRIVMSLLVILDVCSLCLCMSFLSEQGLLWRSWVVEIACPLLAPFWLWESKHKMMPMNMPEQSVVMFGLPFTSMISAGYLSMYVPLQECATITEEAAHNDKNSTARQWTALITHEVFSHQSPGALLLCGIVVPGLMYACFVMYTSAFQKIDKQLLCANSLWMIFTSRLCTHLGGGFVSVAAMAMVSWFLALLFVLLSERESARDWREVYGDILLSNESEAAGSSNAA